MSCNPVVMMKTIGILGTGRLGTHLASTWAAAGHTVMLGSRDSSKAQLIVRQILSPQGFTGEGGAKTPPFPGADQAKLTGTDYVTAAQADIVVLATPFSVTSEIILALKPQLSGKIIIDSTNPFYSGTGLPPGQPFDSAIEYHRNVLNDSTAVWATAYKTVYWTKLVPGGSGSFDMCGDAAAKSIVAELAASHGFAAADRGGFEHAAALEPGRRR